ncbi:MAG: Holliday junction resolvase RuvX [Planctomycetia bacterium]|nr:Holliday junction resolvase RuvX [Planctomycetia bacterium]
MLDGDRSERRAERPANASFPARGRLLGLDYGTKRIGLALSNLEQTIATPHETYERRDETQDARHLARTVKEFAVVGLVVGLPVHMSGDEGEKAREARTFGEWVARVTSLPVMFTDERYTTAQADEHLFAAQVSPKKRKALRDMLAAQILLQAFLDSPRDQVPPGPLD